MGIGQQQLTGKIATRDLMLRSSTLKQGSLSDKIDCAEVSSFIYDVIAENQKDDARKLLSLALKVRKFSLNANLGGFVNTLRKYITGELIDNFIEQLIEKYTTEEQRKAFIQEVCEIVLDPFPGLRVAEKFSQILNKEYVTEEYSNTSLHLAAEQGDLNAVKYFVEKGGDISAQDEIGYTPLHLAAKQGNLDIIKYLVEKGADINVKDNGGETPLYSAASYGKLDVVAYLVTKGADLDARTLYRDAPLHLAAKEGHLDVVKYLIESVVDINVRKGHCNRALLSSAMNGNLDMVKYLIENGTDINAKDSYGNTALHNAANNGCLDVVKYLVEKGADINAKDNGGETPLYSAARYGYLDVVKYLESKGARRYRRSIESDNLAIENTQAVSRINKLSSWTNNSIINWVKGLVSSTESPDLLTSRGHDNTTVTAVPEINTTVVNNTIMLGILATGLFNKTKHKQPIHENLLSPREQSMRLNNIDENMIIKAIQQAEEESFEGPNTYMDEAKVSGNKTGMWKRK